MRIPAAWDCHADQSTLTIDPAWMARVKEVVDYAHGQGMYVILNIHWDGGWLEEHPLYSHQPYEVPDTFPGQPGRPRLPDAVGARHPAALVGIHWFSAT